MNCPVGGRWLDDDGTLLDEVALGDVALAELVALMLEAEEPPAGRLDADDRLGAWERWLTLELEPPAATPLALDVSLGRGSDDPAVDDSASAEALETLLELLDAVTSTSGPGPGVTPSGPGAGAASSHSGSQAGAHPQPL